MINTAPYQKVVTAVLRSALPAKHYVPILHLFNKWIRVHGAAWFVQRMKDLLLEVIVPENQAPVRRNKQGCWLGPIKYLYLLSQKSISSRKKVIFVLKCISLLRADITKEDYIAYQKNLDLLLENIPDLGPPGAMPFHETRYEPPPYPLYDKKAVLGRNKRKIYHEIIPEEHVESLSECPSLTIKHFPLIKEFVNRCNLYRYTVLKGRVKEYVGQAILLNKDGKLKKRLIFSPFPIFQLLTSRLHQALEQYAQECCPNLFYKDQDQGRRLVADWLKIGPVTSIDLTSATERIPLEFQISLLHDLFPSLKADIDLFEDLAKAVYFTSYKDVDICLGGRGQPMGLLPSFLCFSVSIYYLCNEISPGKFLQVGDDLVSRDPKLLSELSFLGIDISLEKSLIDKSVAEFCGDIIYASGPLGVNSPKSTTGQGVVSLGYKAYKHLLPAWVSRVLRLLPPPYGTADDVAWMPSEFLLSLFETEDHSFSESPIREDTNIGAQIEINNLLAREDVSSDPFATEVIKMITATPSTFTSLGWVTDRTIPILFEDNFREIPDRSDAIKVNRLMKWFLHLPLPGDSIARGPAHGRKRPYSPISMWNIRTIKRRAARYLPSSLFSKLFPKKSGNHMIIPILLMAPILQSSHDDYILTWMQSKALAEADLQIYSSFIQRANLGSCYLQIANNPTQVVLLKDRKYLSVLNLNSKGVPVSRSQTILYDNKDQQSPVFLIYFFWKEDEQADVSLNYYKNPGKITITFQPSSDLPEGRPLVWEDDMFFSTHLSGLIPKEKVLRIPAYNSCVLEDEMNKALGYYK